MSVSVGLSFSVYVSLVILSFLSFPLYVYLCLSLFVSAHRLSICSVCIYPFASVRLSSNCRSLCSSVCAVFLSLSLPLYMYMFRDISISLALMIRISFCFGGTNRSFPVEPLPDHRWNVVKRYKLTPGKLEGVDVGKDHLLETLVSDLKKDLRDQGFGSQLVGFIASAPMPTDSDSAILSVAAITGCFVLSSVGKDWPSLSPPSPAMWRHGGLKRCRRRRRGEDAQAVGRFFPRAIVAIWVSSRGMACSFLGKRCPPWRFSPAECLRCFVRCLIARCVGHTSVCLWHREVSAERLHVFATV